MKSNRRFSLLFGLVLAASALALLACTERQAGTRHIELPAGWPLAELAPPAGAKPAQLPEVYAATGDGLVLSGRPFGSGTNVSGKTWAVAFGWRGKWDAAWRHVDACLKPAGYLLSDRSDPKTELSRDYAAAHPLEAIYVNQEFTRVIRLSYENDVFVLRIQQYDQPQSKILPLYRKARPIP